MCTALDKLFKEGQEAVLLLNIVNGRTTAHLAVAKLRAKGVVDRTCQTTTKSFNGTEYILWEVGTIDSACRDTKSLVQCASGMIDEKLKTTEVLIVSATGTFTDWDGNYENTIPLGRSRRLVVNHPEFAHLHQ